MPKQSAKKKTKSNDRTSHVLRVYELQHREEGLLDLLRSYPNQIVRSLAMRPEAGWHLGRLYLVGAIEWKHYSAAVYLDRVTRAYEKMLRRYGHVRAARLEKMDAPTAEDLSKSAQKKFDNARKKYDRVYGILDQCGTDVRKAVVDALREDAHTDLTLILRGLTVIDAGLLRVNRGGRLRSSRTAD